MKAIKIASVCLVILALAVNAKAVPQVPPQAPAKVCSAIIYDLDNEVILFEQNADEKIPPASLTKVLSMFLGMDHIAQGKSSLEDVIDISPLAAAVGGSRMGLRADEKVSLHKLLMGMAVSSGNDASHALAEHVGGSAEAFVRMMNARCRMLGMEDSNFANPHGLPAEGQFTTARDMLTLARAYLKAHPYALAFHNTRVLEHRGYKTWNKNPLLGQYPGADGLKTGWIRASGYNMIFTATRNNHRLLAVIMGAPDTYVRSAEACRLLDAGFSVCDNRAVSVAAALENLPFDLNRIDPRKTARDHGLLKPRLLADRSGSVKSPRAGTHRAGKLHKALLAKNRAHSGKYAASLAKNRLKVKTAGLDHKSGSLTAKLKTRHMDAKSKAHSATAKIKAKSGARVKTHAEKRGVRARRG